MLISPTFMICEVCGEHRSKRVHRKCSRILQKRHNAEEAERIRKETAKADLLESITNHQIARNRRITKK